MQGFAIFCNLFALTATTPRLESLPARVAGDAPRHHSGPPLWPLRPWMRRRSLPSLEKRTNHTHHPCVFRPRGRRRWTTCKLPRCPNIPESRYLRSSAAQATTKQVPWECDSSKLVLSSRLGTRRSPRNKFYIVVHSSRAFCSQSRAGFCAMRVGDPPRLPSCFSRNCGFCFFYRDLGQQTRACRHHHHQHRPCPHRHRRHASEHEHINY